MAREAGVGESTVFRYFPSGEALLKACPQDVTQEPRFQCKSPAEVSHALSRFHPCLSPRKRRACHRRIVGRISCTVPLVPRFVDGDRRRRPRLDHRDLSG
ncbi:helix-turn-helix domain-containing protein [Paraburkholderia sartisoli]|uniref:helix-turn-helix domain-containing protein n=1 Tax=Paraburkholderia sartisoli TaxID=83784 RepID=UPI0038994654